MSVKLHQILALEKTAKGTTESEVTRAYKDAQKTVLFQGLTRVYSPKDADDRDQLPSERKMVQMTAQDVLGRAVNAWVRQSDLVATKDTTNQEARADVIVDGVTIVDSVPVTTLLYLEKKLQDVTTLVKALPVLDPEVNWGTAPDAATGLWKSQPDETVRSKKVPKAFVKAPATDKHPAQVEMFTEDVIVGTWARTLFSGALPAGRKIELLNRIGTLSQAVKMAREYANRTDVIDMKIGAKIFNYLLAD